MIISKYSLKLQTCIFNFLFHSSTWLADGISNFSCLYITNLLIFPLTCPINFSVNGNSVLPGKKLKCHSTFLFHTLSIKRNFRRYSEPPMAMEAGLLPPSSNWSCFHIFLPNSTQSQPMTFLKYEL